MKMITITDKSACCGCTSCESVCSTHKAISMQPDDQGFLYPLVDSEKCVNCGLCNRVCPCIQEKSIVSDYQKIYGARLKNLAERNRSQSGGAFQAVARYFIKSGGLVYGVTLDESMTVRHSRVSNISELPKLYGSKYVQSNMENIFAAVVDDLKRGKSVLFSGVGCQVAGLVNLCRVRHVNTEKLITVDLVCYGVPSPGYWKDFVSSQNRIYKSPIYSYSFRNKELFGWKNSRSSFTLSDGREVVPAKNFYNTLLFRRSCSVCPFTTFERISDITIGDFWGIEKVKPEWAADDSGVSLIIVNSLQGAQIFEAVNDQMEYFESNREECWQPQLSSPNPIHPLKDEWEHSYREHGFEVSARKFDIVFTPTAWKCFQLRIKNLANRLASMVK